MATEKSAGAVVYRLTEDHTLLFLLLQAAPGKPWGFPKGKLDPGETEENAALREIEEETSLNQLVLDEDFRLAIHYNYRRGRKLVKKEVIYFLARAETAEVHISWEHVAFRWASLKEAFELVAYENARDTLRKACTHLIEQHGLRIEM